MRDGFYESFGVWLKKHIRDEKIKTKQQKYKLGQKAFSLIEVLLVLFIIAFLIPFASQKLFKKGQKVRAVFDKLIRLNNRLVSVSTLHNKTYRLVIQLDTEKRDQYWVEKKQSIGKFEEEEEEKINSDFQIDDSFYSDPQEVPSLLDITKIETKGSVAKAGKVYIYYYPSALAQFAKIYFLRPDNQGIWTLYLDPVTKKLQTIQGEK